VVTSGPDQAKEDSVKVIRFGGPLLLAFALVAAVPVSAGAQAAVTNADLQRLQDNIYDASRDVAQLRSRDSALASELETELDEARDETVYLRVKLRKNESIARSEYSGLRDRIENIRSRARGDAAGASTAATGTAGNTTREPREPGRNTSTSGSRSTADPDSDVPVGTELDVRLQRGLNSGTAQVEERFEGTTVVDLKDGDRVLIPAGSMMRGVVSSVTSAGRVERKGSLTVSFDQITIRGRNYPIRATVTEALESEGIRGEAGRIGAGAGVGAIIGGILGGFKGALAGILIGGGGTIAATEGKEVDLPAGTVLRVRMDTGLDLK
jgi:hypothetical protein